MLDAKTRERDFPSLMKMNYLNTAAEGIPPKVVGAALEQYAPLLRSGKGCPSESPVLAQRAA